MPPAWKNYQEEAATFFRSLGLEASTDVKIDGARTSHDIDVLVKSIHAGFEIIWLVECKHWKTSVSKLHVFALREIVNETGADRGILLCETGFQSGAIDAANLTNVKVTSLAKMTESTKNEVYAMRLHEFHDRVEACHARYWEIPKDRRIEHGLRTGFGQFGYSGDWVAVECKSILSKAFRGQYPFQCDEMKALLVPDLPKQMNSVEEVVAFLEATIRQLEEKLDSCEATSAAS